MKGGIWNTSYREADLGFGWEPQPLSKLLNISEAQFPHLEKPHRIIVKMKWGSLGPGQSQKFVVQKGLAPSTVIAVVLFNLSFDQVRFSK